MPEEESLRFILEDEAGEEHEYEVIGTFTLDDRDYIALLPTEDPEEGVKLLGFHAGEQDELLLDSIEDDEEYRRAAEAFEDIFNGNIPADLFEEVPPEDEDLEFLDDDWNSDVDWDKEDWDTEDELSLEDSEERENKDE